MQIERDMRVALLRGKTEQLIYLTAVKQQLSVTQRVMIKYISLFIRTYMHAVHKQLAAAHRAE